MLQVVVLQQVGVPTPTPGYKVWRTAITMVKSHPWQSLQAGSVWPKGTLAPNNIMVVVGNSAVSHECMHAKGMNSCMRIIGVFNKPELMKRQQQSQLL